MRGKVKEWGVLAELCLVVAGFPLSVLAPQVLWQVLGEHQGVGVLTLLVQFLGVCVVVVVLMLVDTLLDALFLALTRSRVATQICSAAVFVAVVAALFSVWVPWSLGLVLTSAVSALVVLLFSKLATERYAALLERNG
ncbi:hypothetical protein EAE32_02595 [Kocuria tytonicola]|uniref:Uncharacterized protein n=1 Tax=Kocuria tytonicola TaxID=2055946 RepID=A0A3L9L7K0_9MICC|nr:hypothetical protein [Kocuria tytonicola]RLY94134.1 hypothetical protein EAE32_02595 [Kocuria tytonicola]